MQRRSVTPTLPRGESSPNRIGSLYAELRSLAFARGPEAKLPTMQELRDEYGVSQATITAALDLLEREEVVYRVPRFGIFVSPKLHRKTILVIMNSSLQEANQVSPFWGMLWGLFTREAQRRSDTRNEQILFHTAPPGIYPPELPLPDSIVQQIETGQADGVLSIGLHANGINELVRHEAPLVVFAGPGHWMVRLAHEELVALLVPSLAARGCRKIALWRPSRNRFGDLDDDLDDDPDDSYAEAAVTPGQVRDELRRNGLTLLPDFIQDFRHLPLAERPASLQAEGYELILDIFQRETRPRPDGVLSADDMITSGALSAMHELGLKPDDDLIIATHSNRGAPTLFGYHHRLIRAEFDPQEIVAAMFRKLDLLMEGKTPEQAITRVSPRLT